MSEEEKITEYIERMIKALKHFDCYVFEKEDLEIVSKIAELAGIRKMVTIRRADPRYEYIYVLAPRNIDLEDECRLKARQLLAEGKIDRLQYKKYFDYFVVQCIRHKERERVKEIISRLEHYIRGVKGGASSRIERISFGFT